MKNTIYRCFRSVFRTVRGVLSGPDDRDGAPSVGPGPCSIVRARILLRQNARGLFTEMLLGYFLARPASFATV